MTNNFLLPNKYKTVGWFLLIPATILGVALIASDFEGLQIRTKIFALINDSLSGDNGNFSMIDANITPTLVGILFLVGALLVSFSKEKKEDEFIARLRQTSLLWAVLVNYSLLLVAFVAIHGLAFLNVMVYNMFTILIIFIIRFNYLLYKSSKAMPNEKYNQSATSY